MAWYGALNMYLIPFFLVKSENSSEQNWEPLSDTIRYGTPNLTKTEHSAETIHSAIAVLVLTISGHLVAA